MEGVISDSHPTPTRNCSSRLLSRISTLLPLGSSVSRVSGSQATARTTATRCWRPDNREGRCLVWCNIATLWCNIATLLKWGNRSVCRRAIKSRQVEFGSRHPACPLHTAVRYSIYIPYLAGANSLAETHRRRQYPLDESRPE